MKVTLVTFAGRQETMEVLFAYVRAYKKHWDTYHIYVATHIESDIACIERFATAMNLEYGNVVRVMHCPDDLNKDKSYVWNRAYNECQDDDTVYLKLDDDIVFMEESLFTELIPFRIAHPEYLLVFPIIINNIMASWYLQEKGLLNCPEKTTIGYTWKSTYERIKHALVPHDRSLQISQVTHQNEILCPVSWGSIDFCKDVHNTFLAECSSQNFHVDNWVLDNCEPMSIQCCAWIGTTLKSVISRYGDVFEDEPWLTIYAPTWTSMRNCMFGGAVVAHYAYYVQRERGINATDILHKYRQYALKNKIDLFQKP